LTIGWWRRGARRGDRGALAFRGKLISDLAKLYPGASCRQLGEALQVDVGVVKRALATKAERSRMRRTKQ
jgi:hypothetical protein